MAEWLSAGARVKMLDKKYNKYAKGEITLIRRNRDTGIHEAKVLWDGDSDLNYDYYPLKDLEPEDA